METMIAPQPLQWEGRTHGTGWMQKSLIVMMRHIPSAVMYGVMALIVPFYMIFRPKSFLAIYHYFRQKVGYGRIKSFFSVYLNHFLFGQVVLDRFSAFAGKRFRYEVEGMAFFDELESAPGGFLMLSSHVGSYEMAGYMLVSKKKTINAVVFAGESATVSRYREQALQKNNMRPVVVRNDMSHLFALNAALDRGEIVTMDADRANGSRKSVHCSFMHSDATFPEGPFTLARLKEVPMLAVFVMKEGIQRYRILVRQVSNAREYASELENVLHRYPAQWFNFYDFWSGAK